MEQLKVKGRSVYNWAVERVAFRLGDMLLQTNFVRQLDRQREISGWGEKQIEQLQLEKLEKMLSFSGSKSPYYKSLGIAKNSDPEHWLRNFPVLEKSVLRAHTQKILTRPQKELILYSTSGSSGIQTEIYIDQAEEALLRAILVHWWEWTGYYLGKPIFQTGMTPQRGRVKKIKDLITRTQYMVAFGLDEKEVLNHLKPLEGKSGFHLGGYASSLYVLAEIAQKHGLDIQFDGAISWGDKMFDHYQSAIESAFSTKVYENYGLNEGFMVGQKKDIEPFYIYSPNVYLEILDENWEPVPDGEMGRVVLTKLDGFAMPLIRYYTGDLAIKLPRSEYPEKRDLAYPLLKKVIGRDTDIVYTKSGKKLIVHFFTGIFEFYPEIRQFRVIQDKQDAILIEIIIGDDFSDETLTKIRTDIASYVSEEELKISFHTVDNIPSTASGKPQIVQSNI